jgi:hypothetical protein
MRVGLWLGVRTNTGGCARSLLITIYTGLDRILTGVIPAEYLFTVICLIEAN